MTKGIKIKDETHTGLKALAQYGDSLDGVIQKLIRFYLSKHTESKRIVRPKGGTT